MDKPSNNPTPAVLRLASPNGTVWLIALTDAGELTVAPAAAPEAKRQVAFVMTEEDLAAAVARAIRAGLVAAA